MLFEGAAKVELREEEWRHVRKGTQLVRRRETRDTAVKDRHFVNKSKKIEQQKSSGEVKAPIFRNEGKLVNLGPRSILR